PSLPAAVHSARPATLLPYTTLFRSSFDHRQEDGRRAPSGGVIHDRPSVQEKHHPQKQSGQPQVEVAPPRERALIRRESRKIFQADRKSTRLNSSHVKISYAVFCLKT